MMALSHLGAFFLGLVVMFVTLWTLDLVGPIVEEDDDDDDGQHPVKA